MLCKWSFFLTIFPAIQVLRHSKGRKPPLLTGEILMISIEQEADCSAFIFIWIVNFQIIPGRQFLPGAARKYPFSFLPVFDLLTTSPRLYFFFLFPSVPLTLFPLLSTIEQFSKFLLPFCRGRSTFFLFDTFAVLLALPERFSCFDFHFIYFSYV